MILGLSGKKCSGKSWAASYIIEQYTGVELAFAAPLKELARSLFARYLSEDVDPWNDKRPEVRRFLQVLGTDLFRAYDPDVWVRLCVADAARHTARGTNVVISDLRFPNEADAIVAAGGLVLRCEADEAVRAERVRRLYEDSANDTHPSETALDGYPNQVIIRTSTVEQMREDVDRALGRAGLKKSARNTLLPP